MPNIQNLQYFRYHPEYLYHLVWFSIICIFDY